MIEVDEFIRVCIKNEKLVWSNGSFVLPIYIDFSLVGDSLFRFCRCCSRGMLGFRHVCWRSIAKWRKRSEHLAFREPSMYVHGRTLSWGQFLTKHGRIRRQNVHGAVFCRLYVRIVV